jgi:hypothetical protein
MKDVLNADGIIPMTRGSITYRSPVRYFKVDPTSGNEFRSDRRFQQLPEKIHLP